MRARLVVFLLLAFIPLLDAVDVGGQARGPWPLRRRPGLRANTLLAERVLPEDWPAEPLSPREVDVARFSQALRSLCFGMPARRAESYARWVTADAREHGVDPFLLGALVYRESRCDPEALDLEGVRGIGLTQIPWDLYHPQVEGGVLSYAIGSGARREERAVRVDRFPFGPIRLQQAEANLYFAAALLSMWQAQHETVDEAFGQAPHRHWVSHFLWGDRVRSDVEEERVLTDRRRLLELYGASPGMAPLRWRGVELGCPLHGCPRVVLSWLGAERGDGQREHRGIDVDALPNEAVRAMADGIVTFAGVDLPGQLEHVQVRDQAGYAAHPRDGLGAGGRYVCIRHGDGDGSFASCYMHLEEVHVAYPRRVRRGEVIGTVGRTGMRASAAHLHLEIRTARVEDPSQILAGLLLGRMPTSARDRR
ncbi:MAG: peptidoglycan DD-metalloendopeptidase family protein [Deltaproteobacteria bacterium]